MSASDTTIRAFKKTVWGYWKAHGRHAMPWRHTTDAYRIAVSEVMLQQTQVSRVEEKYAEFIKRFPNWRSLARASVADVLLAWQGLGYNRRALALRSIAQVVVTKYKGKLPDDPILLDELPGIGAGTAGSICAFAFNRPVPFIETNIRRVYIHFFFSKQRSIHDNDIMPLVGLTIDQRRAREWFWALMDYGAMLASREQKNPNTKSVHYSKQSKFEGSDRQIRGKILKLLIAHGPLSQKELALRLGEPSVRVSKIARDLAREKFVVLRKGDLHISM